MPNAPNGMSIPKKCSFHTPEDNNVDLAGLPDSISG
jgi:hypothetical protein